MGLTVTTQPVKKPWYLSWTFWFNTIGAIGSVAQLALTIVPVSPATAILVGVVTATNIALRFKTSTALTK